MGSPSPLFSDFLLHKSRYAHLLESLFKNIPGFAVAVFLNTVFLSSYLASLHKFENLERTVFKDLWIKKYLRLKPSKYKAKLNLQKNYYIRQENNKIRIIKKQWNNKRYSALPASLPFTFLSSDPKKENVKLHFSGLQNI